MDRIYSRINWKDEPDLTTPLGAVNLNKMDSALYTIDGRVVDLDNIVNSLSSEVTGITSDVDDLEQNKADKSEIVDKFADLNDIAFNNLRNGQVPKYNSTTQKWENADESGGGGSGGHIIQNPSGSSMTQRNYLQFTGTGISVTDDNTNGKTVVTVTGGTGGSKGHLIVISETGSIVRITKDQTTIYATETSTGHFECDIPEFGVWIIHAVLDDDAQVSLNVDTDKVYIVDDSHFHADITVTYPNGATVSCSKTGEQTMYATGSPYTFTVHSAGVWTIIGTRSGGGTETQTVNITTSGQTESVTLTIIPDGSTVTPTDDVQILLNCANIWDKTTYTTISDLLADDTSLLTVLTSDNAIDYLVRSTTFASAITADEDAMEMIGSYDYASDTLLADSTWATAIIGSAYNTSVANVSTPKMTSKTTPSGECISSSNYSGQPEYQAFDQTVSTAWSANTQQYDNTQYVGYKFPHSVKLYGASYKARVTSPFKTKANVKYQTSDTGSSNDWIDATASFVLSTFDSTNVETITAFSTVASKQYVRLLFGTVVEQTGGLPNPTAVDLRFYGRENGGVQSWLKSANIDKPYTTLAEVLADTTTLATLIASQSAVDYLVTAKAFIDGIVADATAMSYIGLNNYCANTLLADADWADAIAKATNIESVSNVKVPTMTGATTPSGQVISDGVNYATGYEPWKAFRGATTGNLWCLQTALMSGNHYCGYIFTKAVKIFGFKMYRNSSASFTPTIKIQGSNDGNTWNDVYTIPTKTYANRTWHIFGFPLSDEYAQYRVYGVFNSAGSDEGMALQFYGREDV